MKQLLQSQVCSTSKTEIPNPDNVYYSYRYNNGLIRDQNGSANDGFDKMKNLAAYNATAQTVAIYEGAGPDFTMDENENQSAVGNAREVNSSGAGIPTGTVAYPQSGWIFNQNPQATERHLEGSIYLCADGHAKWFKPDSVSYGYRSASSTSGESYSGGSGSRFAQGTEYSGADKKAITFSYR